MTVSRCPSSIIRPEPVPADPRDQVRGAVRGRARHALDLGARAAAARRTPRSPPPRPGCRRTARRWRRAPRARARPERRSPLRPRRSGSRTGWSGCSDDRVAGGGGLVEPPDRRRVRRVPGDLGILAGLAQDLRDDLGEPVERLLRLGLGRLDQQRLVDDQREVDGRRVDAEVEQPLGEVERLDRAARASSARRRGRTRACTGARTRPAGTRARPRAAAGRAGSWRSARRPPRPRAGPRRPSERMYA